MATELMHYAKGTEAKNHKYRSKKIVNGRVVYDYGDGKSSGGTSATRSEQLARSLHKSGILGSYTKVNGKEVHLSRNDTIRQAYQNAEDEKRKHMSSLGAKQRLKQNTTTMKKVPKKKTSAPKSRVKHVTSGRGTVARGSKIGSRKVGSSGYFDRSK